MPKFVLGLAILVAAVVSLVAAGVSPGAAADPTPALTPLAALTPQGTATTVRGQPFVILIAAEALDSPVVLPEDPTTRDLAHALRSLSIFAGDQLCAQVQLTDARLRDSKGNIAVTIGSAGQQAACRTEGSVIRFVDAKGRQLFEKLTLKPGTTAVLSNFGPQPADTGDIELPRAGVGVSSKIKAAQGSGGLPPLMTAAGIICVTLGLGTLAFLLLGRFKSWFRPT
jgi:hypothetical protein